MTNAHDVKALVAELDTAIARLERGDDWGNDSEYRFGLLSRARSALTEAHAAGKREGVEAAAEFLTERAEEHEHAAQAVFSDKEAPSRHSFAAKECRFSATAILALNLKQEAGDV